MFRVDATIIKIIPKENKQNHRKYIFIYVYIYTSQGATYIP